MSSASPSRRAPVVRLSQVHAIVARSHALRDAEFAAVQRAAAAFDAILRAAPVRIVPALDRAFRDAGLHARLGLEFVELSPALVARLDRLEHGRSAALGVASLVRSGHAREAAVQRLQALLDPLATAFLINRLNDYVPAIARLAWAGLEPRVVPRHVETLVACLPLVERMGSWVRAGAAWQARLRGVLLAPEPRCRAALWAGARSSDDELRRAACVLLAEIHAGQPEMQAVLEAALAARDPQIRRWAARVVVDVRRTPPAVLWAVTPLLERDPAPSLRLTGLQVRIAAGERAAIEAAAFDPHAELRHQARVCLATSFAPLDYRGVALATLARPGASRDELVAALATLSDFGRAADLPAVAALADDPRASLAREARRTLAILRRS